LLPTVVDTLRLFCVVMWHPALRPTITTTGQVPGFLNSVVALPDGPKLAAIVLKRLSVAGFFRSDFDRVFVDEDVGVVLSGIVTVSVGARVEFIPAFVGVARAVVNLVRNNANKIASMILNAALPLCGFQKCLEVFREQRFEMILRKIK
jgi:hypothetical protein